MTCARNVRSSALEEPSKRWRQQNHSGTYGSSGVNFRHGYCLITVGWLKENASQILSLVWIDRKIKLWDKGMDGRWNRCFSWVFPCFSCCRRCILDLSSHLSSHTSMIIPVYFVLSPSRHDADRSCFSCYPQYFQYSSVEWMTDVKRIRPRAVKIPLAAQEECNPEP